MSGRIGDIRKPTNCRGRDLSLCELNLWVVVENCHTFTTGQ